MSDIFLNVIRIMRKNNILNIAFVTTYILSVVCTVFMNNYIEHYIKKELYRVPGNFNSIAFLKCLPLDEDGGTVITMQKEDLEYSRMEFQSEADLAPIVSVNSSVLDEQFDKIGLKLCGIDKSFLEVYTEIPLVSGNFFLGNELEEKNAKVVISYSLSRKIFGTTESIGRQISLNNYDLVVCGVTDKSYFEYFSGSMEEDYAIVSFADYSKVTGIKSEEIPIELIMAKYHGNDINNFIYRYYKFFEETLSGGSIHLFYNYKTLAQIVKENTQSYRFSNLIIQFISYFGILVALVNLIILGSANRYLQSEKFAIKKALGISKMQIRVEVMFEYAVTSVTGTFIGWIIANLSKQFFLRTLKMSADFIEIPSLIICILLSLAVTVIIAMYNAELIYREKKLIADHSL